VVEVAVEESAAMKATPESEKARKPYAKPVAKRVHLKPEEAVLGNCKSSGGSGPSAANCGLPIACASAGS
jgi:hypothetical protein